MDERCLYGYAKYLEEFERNFCYRVIFVSSILTDGWDDLLIQVEMEISPFISSRGDVNKVYRG